MQKKNPDKRERLPITPKLLMQMRLVWSRGDPKNFDNTMLWAACCTCYFVFLRSGEVTVPLEAAYNSSAHLNISDTAVDSINAPSTIKLRIKASKTDQFWKGVDIFLRHTDNHLCPVEALLVYIAKRDKEQGLLFRFEDKRLLTKD